MHAMVDHRSVIQLWIFAHQSDSSDPNAGLIHVDFIFHATGDHTGAAVNAARRVEEKSLVLDIPDVCHDATSQAFFTITKVWLSAWPPLIGSV
jgi:hypothetical protein